MKPFLLLQSRPEDAASDNEYEAFLKFGKLKSDELRRIRIEKDGMPNINLDSYAAIILGGGPSNMSDPNEQKSAAQKTFEPQLAQLLDHIIARDSPFLGACYGIGVVVAHQNGTVSRTFGEPVGAVEITLTDEGKRDPLLAGIESSFDAFVGHKEACEILPESATLLASSNMCPVQMFRIKQNIYVTQFHPELDAHGLETRIQIYKHAGYFPPNEADKLIAKGYAANVTEPVKILQAFVERYRN